jgi:dipeptidase E
MRQLFLTSSFADVSEIFFKSVKGPLKGKTVTFIPTASLHEEVTFYVDAAKEELEKQGLLVDIIEISTATTEEILSKLKDNDYIYVIGGNTFFLLSELRRTGADEVIIEQIKLGKLYIGESAGSIILSPNIEYVKDMDDFKLVKSLTSYSSLEVIDFYPLPHVTNFPFKEVTEKIISNYTDKVKLIPFTNAQAIWVNGDNIVMLG